VHQQEEPEAVNEDEDEMPDVQETVAVVPGSTLLWRISSRPSHSAEVHAVIFKKNVLPSLFLTLVVITVVMSVKLYKGP